MRIIQQNKNNPQQLEIAWMWLPTFIGQNRLLLNELDKAFTDNFKIPIGVIDNDELEIMLDIMNFFAIFWLRDKLKIPGLDKHLLGLYNINHDKNTLDDEFVKYTKLITILSNEEEIISQSVKDIVNEDNFHEHIARILGVRSFWTKMISGVKAVDDRTGIVVQKIKEDKE
jgi:hypothetical protein